MRRRALVTGALAGAGALVGCRSAPAPASPSAPPPTVAPPSRDDPKRASSLATLERIGVIGASVSAGFGDGIPLAPLVEAGCGKRCQVFDASSSAVFLRPVDLGRVQQQLMRLRQVRLVLGVDFLFWFAYGDEPAAVREAELEMGLRLLEALPVPTFVGDLPDIAGASPQMIAPAQIPGPDQLAAFNARILGWARTRPQVRVLPLAAWHAELRAGASIEAGGRRISADPSLLQWDRLHPTPWGQAVLAALVLEAVMATLPGLRPEDLTLDPVALLALHRERQGLGDLPAPPSP